ncbi:MAG: hypothetical protein M1840_002117 [Geoglossum simile]|nr:MAG: hypothetical protein M1840_002117 [Geoglossum simile]
MDFMISLAHFCEVHGPTSILCTQILPISCLTCYPASGHSHNDDVHAAPPSWHDSRSQSLDTHRQRPTSAPTSRAPSFSRRSGLGTSPQRSALLNQHIQQQSRLHAQASKHNSASSSSISSPRDTPPTSPRSPHLPSAEAYLSDSFGSDAGACHVPKRYTGGMGRGAGGGITASTDTCANCSLSLPKSVSEQLPEGAPGSPTKDGKGKNGSPVLRTREAFVTGVDNWVQEDSDHGYARRSRAKIRKDHYRDISRPSSSKSSRNKLHEEALEDSPDPSDDDNGLQSSTELEPAMINSGLSRTGTSGTASTSTSSSSSSDEQRHLDTPTGPHSHTLTYLTTRNPPSQNAYSLLRRACIRTLSCELLPRTGSGSLVFGDPQAGYTIAYVFRIRDPRARGGRRGYALICLAGRDERRVMRIAPCIMRWFESTASWIVSMADREANTTHPPTSPASIISQSPTNMGMTSHAATTSAGGLNVTPVSPFLSGRSHDPDGFLRRGTETRAKGLAELVGREDFFVELHAVFVRLLGQLGHMIGGLESLAESIGSGLRDEDVETRLERGMGSMKLSHNNAGRPAEKEVRRHNPHRRYHARRQTVDIGMSNVSINTSTTTIPATATKPASLVPDMPRARHLDTRLRQEFVA